MSREDTTKLVSLTKQVIRSAAKWGLEEAGTWLMGPAWTPFKEVMAPVIAELERRFPRLFLLKEAPSGAQAAEANRVARQAVAAIDADPALQQMLTDGFDHLEHGQFEIKEQIGKISARLEAIDSSLSRLSSENDRNFVRIIEQLVSIQEQLNSSDRSMRLENEAILFPLSINLPEGAVEVYVTLYMAGQQPIHFEVNRSHPFSTVNVSVPRFGTYYYRIENNEVTTLYAYRNGELQPELVNVLGSSDDYIEIEPNRTYKLERSMILSKGGNKMTYSLEKVLTSAERAEREEEWRKDLEDPDKFLDSIDRSLGDE